MFYSYQDKLSLLDLEGFAQSCEAMGKGKRYQQFRQIKEELRFPSYDIRKPLQEPTPGEIVPHREAKVLDCNYFPGSSYFFS